MSCWLWKCDTSSFRTVSLSCLLVAADWISWHLSLNRCFLHQVCVEWRPEEALWEAVNILRPLCRAHPCVIRAWWVEATTFWKSPDQSEHLPSVHFNSQVSTSPWSCPAGGANLRTSHGLTAWQRWLAVTFVGPMRPPGWPGEPWWDTPTSLACSSIARSAPRSTRGFQPWSIWCRQVRRGGKPPTLTVVGTVSPKRRLECFNAVTPVRFDDIRGAEAPGGLAVTSQQVLGSLHVVRQLGPEGAHRGPHQQRRGAHSHSHCTSSDILSLCRPKEHGYHIFFPNVSACPVFCVFRSWIVYGKSVWSCTVLTGSACLLSILRFSSHTVLK